MNIGEWFSSFIIQKILIVIDRALLIVQAMFKPTENREIKVEKWGQKANLFAFLSLKFFNGIMVFSYV